MRIRFSAIAAALALVFTATSVQAEIYTLYTKGAAIKPGTGTSQTSSLGIALSAFGGLINIPAFGQPPISSTLEGTVIIDMNLNASNTGTAYIVGSDLVLAPLSFNNGSGVSISSTPIHVTIKSDLTPGGPGAIPVTNGVFGITGTNVGTLALDSGTLTYSIVIPPVVNEVGSFDFAVDPQVVKFTDLGTAVLGGTADHASTGFDTGTPDGTSHFLPGNLNQPGITGLDPNDNDGAEFNLNFNGFSTTITGDIPIVIKLSGGVFVSVPEVGSITMMGLAGAGLGLVGVARRRARNS